MWKDIFTLPGLSPPVCGMGRLRSYSQNFILSALRSLSQWQVHYIKRPSHFQSYFMNNQRVFSVWNFVQNDNVACYILMGFQHKDRHLTRKQLLLRSERFSSLHPPMIESNGCMTMSISAHHFAKSRIGICKIVRKDIFTSFPIFRHLCCATLT